MEYSGRPEIPVRYSWLGHRSICRKPGFTWPSPPYMCDHMFDTCASHWACHTESQQCSMLQEGTVWLGSEMLYSAVNHSVQGNARLTYLSESDREEELGGLVLISQIVQCSAVKLCAVQGSAVKFDAVLCSKVQSWLLAILGHIC